MASVIDVSGLTMNPEEQSEFAQFIIEQVFNKPELASLHNIQTGVQMKEQIVLAGQLGKTGVKGTATCTRKNSGASAIMTQKYWEPQGIEDTLVHCNAEFNALFKAYFGKISSYKEKYEIEGSDLAVFLTILVEESMNDTIYRAAWLGNSSVAVAGAAADGLVLAADVKFYDYFDGLFEQIFTGVTATTISRYTISENAEVTTALQLSLSAGRSVEIFEGVWANADSRLKSSLNRKLYVSNEVWENYRQYLQGKGENFTIDYTVEGFRELKWNGVPVVNMETVWDRFLLADFVDNTTNNAYYLPNRVVLSTPENLPIATLNENDFTDLEIWYEKKERENNIGYGYSLDAKVIEEDMISVAY